MYYSVNPNYILLLGLFLIISCRGEDNLIDPTFRWPGISADSDSLIVKLEKGYIDMVPVDTMSWLLERLKKSSHDCSDGQQILSRYYYWMGRIANRTGNNSHVYLNKARELCDSTRFPYDAMRIGILCILRNDTLDISERYAELKRFERFIDSTNDDFMRASLLLDMGHILYDVRDENKALLNYMKADEIYRRLGISIYHLKTSLNMANMYNVRGLTKQARDLSLRLLGDPIARQDTSFYNNLRLVIYNVTHDIKYLEAGYEEEFVRGRGKTLCLKYEILLGRDALENDDLPECARYINRIINN